MEKERQIVAAVSGAAMATTTRGAVIAEIDRDAHLRFSEELDALILFAPGSAPAIPSDSKGEIRGAKNNGRTTLEYSMGVSEAIVVMLATNSAAWAVPMSAYLAADFPMCKPVPSAIGRLIYVFLKVFSGRLGSFS